MPPVVAGIAAAAGAVGAAGSVGAVTFFGLSGVGAVFAIGAATTAVSALSTVLSKPKFSGGAQSFSVKATNRTLQIKQPIVSRKMLYGETRIGSTLIFAGSTENNKYLHMVLHLAAHEVEAIDEIWVNEDIIPNDYLDENGNVTQGKYAGYMRIKKHLGTADQVADTDLVSEVAEWTSAHRGRGHAYIYVRLEGNRDVFQSGNPDFSAVVRGKKVIDTRDAGASPEEPAKWTPNGALMSHDYLTDEPYGVEVSADKVDSSLTNSAANSCEEIVDTQNQDYTVADVDDSTDILTLSGEMLMLQRGDRVETVTNGTLPSGLSAATPYYVIPYQFAGTPRIKLADSLEDAIDSVAVDLGSTGSGGLEIRKTGEPRYFGGGILDTADTLGQNVRDVLSSMGGTLVHVGFTWSLYAAVYRSPTISFNEDHFRAVPQIDTRVTQSKRYNAVKGVYVAPFNGWQPADYPSYVGSAYVTADNKTKPKYEDIDLPFQQRPHGAQRIAKIALEKTRREIRIMCPMMMHGIQVQAASTCYLNFDYIGWENKVFEVNSHRLAVDQDQGVPTLGTDLQLEETDAAVYNWSSSEEGGVTPAARTNLPDAFTVTVPVGVSLDSLPVETQDGDKTYKILMSWQEHENSLVRNNGRFQIRSRLVGDTVWKSFPLVDGDATQTELFQATIGVEYEIAIRALNSLRRPSPWVTISPFVVGTSGGADSEDWENETLARDGDDWENDTLTSEDWES